MASVRISENKRNEQNWREMRSLRKILVFVRTRCDCFYRNFPFSVSEKSAFSCSRFQSIKNDVSIFSCVKSDSNTRTDNMSNDTSIWAKWEILYCVVWGWIKIYAIDAIPIANDSAIWRWLLVWIQIEIESWIEHTWIGTLQICFIHVRRSYEVFRCFIAWSGCRWKCFHASAELFWIRMIQIVSESNFKTFIISIISI